MSRPIAIDIALTAAKIAIDAAVLAPQTHLDAEIDPAKKTTAKYGTGVRDDLVRKYRNSRFHRIETKKGG